MKAADELDAHIGKRVRLRRMMLGWSQEQLGTALNLTFQQVQKYEKGQNRIGAGRLYRIAEALSVDVSFFYEGMPRHSAVVEPESAEIQAFLSTHEGHVLCQNFLRIRDTATRRRILDLLSTIAGEPS